MGSFYVNFTVKTTSDAVVKFLGTTKRKCFVSSTPNAMTVFFDQEADSQDETVIIELGIHSSKSLAAPVLAVLNHDDDVLSYWLFDRGDLIDQYNSCPGYFDDGSDTPEGGNPERLCAAFFVPECAKELGAILKNTDFVFAVERHEEIARLLKQPWPLVSLGYQNLVEGDLPKGMKHEDFVRVG
jgi:hypothetical protein